MRLPIAAFVAFLGVMQIALAQLAPPSAGSPLQAIPTLAPLVKKVSPSVVNIAIKGRGAQEQNPLFNDPFFRRFFNVPERPTEREIRAAGSGVIVDARQGLIVTNHHVVEHADEISVTLVDGRRLQAKRVGSDPGTDVAGIKVAADGLIAVSLGDSDKLEVGDLLLAIGFAIPANIVPDIRDQLVRYGEARRGQLGITIQDLTPDVAQAMGMHVQQTGAVVTKVEPGSSAARTGLHAGERDHGTRHDARARLRRFAQQDRSSARRRCR